MYKDNARDPLSQRILDLTLEIIFLLTGEDHVLKIHEMVSDRSLQQIAEGGYCRSQSFNTEPPPHSGIHEQHNEKILELTNKIIRLLTGEVPIRCEDVTVYLSMEEWEYVERHKELYMDITMENHQPIVTLNKSASGECHTPVSFSDFGAESITNNMEQYLNKETGSATNTEQETCEKRIVPEKDLNPVAEHTEYPTTDIKEEPDSCEEENQMYSVIYNPTEYTETKYNSTYTGAESVACEEDLSDSDLYPPPEHPQIEYPSTDFNKESPTYDGNLTEKELYKPAEHTQTEWVHEKLDRYLKGYSNLMKINPRESLIESQKPDQSICYTDTVTLNSVHKGNPELSSQMNKILYSKTDFVMHGTNFREEPFTAYVDNSTDSAFKRQHINTVEQPSSCSECGNQFTDHIALKKHQKIHTGKTQFKYPECENYYTDTSRLAAHTNNHTGEKPFKCAECGKCFVYASRLAQHSRIHTGERPFKCQECGKCFINTSHLKTHKMIHTGEKKFKCSECGKCFAQASHLTDHKRIHTGERPYKCDECEKCFSRTSHLASHKMTHTGEKTFKCDECGKCFTFGSHLTEHKRVHTGERPFKCSECGKCFTQASSLAKHKMIHTGEKLFKCVECGKCFTWASSLARHEMIHTQ
uniref:C2H2-type domain-containing protein n=1 Tax=Leptobrachium leishanense TaxID=445787 RepID=A0A8C5WER7_9ANUR